MTLLPLLCLLACHPPTADDTGEAPFVPDLPAGGCGLEGYDWLPVDRMGELVDYEVLQEFSLEASTIDYLLAEAGITGFSPVPHDAKVYRIRYLTQDRGQEIEATGLLSFPDLDEPTEVPSLLWTHGTTGFTDACAPSDMGLEGAGFNVLFAALGFAVAAPDYLGMNGWGEPAPFLHPYLVPEATAVASLDSLRALWRFEQEAETVHLAADPSRRAVIWGGSEGGFAALWADRYAAGYLPELEVVATVALVPPTDGLGLGQHAVTVLGPPTEAMVAHYATANAWYGRPAPLTDVLTDQEPGHIASRVEEVLASGCGDGDLFHGVDEVTDIYLPGFVEGLQAGDLEATWPWSCYLELATLRTTAVPRGHDAPVFFQVSQNDNLVVAEVERDDFPRLCEAGYRMEYLECAGAGHSEGAVLSIPYQLDWVRARLAGEPLPDDVTCVLTEPVDCDAFGLWD